MTEVEKLQQKLNEMQARLVCVVPGTGLASAEEQARAIRESIERIEAGDFDEIVEGGDDI